MTVRLGMVIAAALTALAIVPVLIVVALGAYGSSLGGAVLTGGDGRAEIAVFPAHGRPGSTLKIVGDRWAPSASVTIQIQRQASNGELSSAPLRLGEVIASRRGTFELETTIPGSVIPLGTSAVRIQAVARNGEAPEAALAATFQIDPYSNRLEISVVDAATGRSASAAQIAVEDSFGQEIASASTDADGMAFIEGIYPGQKWVTVRKVDYEIARGPIQIPESGEAAYQFSIHASPGKRIVLFAYGTAGGRDTELVGIDRSSGLRVREARTAPPGRAAPVSMPDLDVYQHFILPLDGEPARGGTRAGNIDALWAMGAAGNRLRSITSGFATALWHSYIGRSVIGDVLFSRASTHIFDPGSHLYVVDPDSGQIVFDRPYTRDILPPILAKDRTRVFFVNWSASSVSVLDLSDGRQSTLVENIPLFIISAIADPSNDDSLLLSANDRSVYRLDLRRGQLIEVYRGTTVQSWIGVTPDGRLMSSGFRSSDIVVTDLETGQVEDVIPLRWAADWVWADRSGPFIFAVGLTWPDVITVQLIDSQTWKLVDVLHFSRFGGGSDGG